MANAIGIAAGICTSVSLLPQLIKMVKEKQPGDISIWMFIILLIGLALWVWYGLQQEDWPIVITNVFSLVVNASILALHLWYKWRH